MEQAPPLEEAIEGNVRRLPERIQALTEQAAELQKTKLPTNTDSYTRTQEIDRLLLLVAYELETLINLNRGNT